MHRDERQQRADELTSLSTGCCNEVWFVLLFRHPLEAFLTRGAVGRGLRGQTEMIQPAERT